MDATDRRGRFQKLRERAEALLADALDTVDGQDDGELRALCRDLLQRQARLERQNEELIRSLERLEASRDSYHRLFDFAPLACLVLDRNGLVVEANLKATSLLGVRRALLGGKPFVTYVAGESHQEFARHRLYVLDTGQGDRCELRLRCRRPGAMQVELYSLALNDPATGERRCFSVITDLTERRRAEARSLHLAAIVESSVDAIIGMDMAGCVLSWNLGAERLYGYAADEMLGRPLAALAPPGRADEVERLFEAARQGRIVSQMETLRQRKDGVLADVSVNLSPIRDASGRVVGLSAIDRDITARKRLRRDLVAARKEAEGANRAKSEFLANMSHEVRNPINAIVGLTRLVLEDAGLSPKQVERLSMVLEASESLLAIVGDILDYSKIEAGKLELEHRPFEPRRLFGSVIDEQRLAAGHKGLELGLEVDPAVPDRLCGDPHRLRQVLVNLVGNAVKFTDMGQVRARVRLARPEELPEAPGLGRVALAVSVSDTGIGIGPEARETIFDSFVQADSGLTKRYAGSGLGLAICRRLTRLLGGDIVVESELGRGSVFRFTAMCAVEAPEARDACCRTALPDDAALPPLSILLVEDNRINRLFAMDLLSSKGHAVTVAASGAEALERLCGGRFDLVLMDVQMPVMDGVAATRAIRAHKGGLFDPSIPVIGLSAYAMKGDRERFMAAGMDDYIAKPIRFEEFFRALRRIMPPRPGQPAEGEAATDAPTARGETPRRPFDAAEARGVLQVSETVFARMAGVFREETPAQLRDLRTALEAGDAGAAAQAAHMLAGSAAGLGATAVRESAGRLESCLRAGAGQDSRSLVLELEQELAAMLAVLPGDRPGTAGQ